MENLIPLRLNKSLEHMTLPVKKDLNTCNLKSLVLTTMYNVCEYSSLGT